MSDSAKSDAPHARLMDATYKWQRHIYDITRKYYLFGRDRLIADLDVGAGGTVLEVACGTGRNLDLVGRRYRKAELFGFDISNEMLISAQKKLGRRAKLTLGDACDFSAKELFDVDGFDRIILSYSLSMIPDWRAALTQATKNLAPGGQVHVVDFGDFGAYPGFFRRGMLSWLAKFHVTPRDDLGGEIAAAAEAIGGKAETQWLYGRYAQIGVITRP